MRWKRPDARLGGPGERAEEHCPVWLPPARRHGVCQAFFCGVPTCRRQLNRLAGIAGGIE